ncbi:hypothetical protein PV327_000146 [Microctonus hyperodae]|uniref:Uncharacterized protein n=1 Tax=Microctonus hyperodae TaxID=165561 RepID=A0AA39G6G4_MICHY|nr:hypothetical protein PV327_000146 [Microctonus hyperodae]
MVGKANILPSYQRFVNGVPVSLFSRRAFRPREKYLIFLVFLTFGVVCFGAFFFLPDFRSGTGGAYNSVYEVYRKIQKAGPELLIPAPPHGVLGPIDPHGPGGYQSGQIHVGLERPGAAIFQDIHLIEDKQKLQKDSEACPPILVMILVALRGLDPYSAGLFAIWKPPDFEVLLPDSTWRFS